MSKARDLSNLIKNLASSVGASLIGFIQAGTGAVAQTIQAKLREERKSVEDFGGLQTVQQTMTLLF